MWWMVPLAILIGAICTLVFWIIVPIVLVMIPIIFAVGTFVVSCLLAFLALNLIVAAMAIEDEKDPRQ